ncbi:AMP-dependent synthetase/ligase [Nocardia wallacei]|uniref:AMP-dependent synthetase/ligase n=1 Tax=Nocardia wallacei TaxID=480035 RepID=UPI00245400B9|nr:AMP-dependent synthetase/ligase [Nocardia wallacei]
MPLQREIMVPVTTPEVEAVGLQHARTMCDLLLSTAWRYPDRVALRSFETGIAWTYSEAMARIGAVLQRLRELGVGTGCVVALMMRNIPQFHIVDSAVMLAGGDPFSVYNTMPPEQVEYVLSDAGARIVIAESGFVPVLRAAVALGAPIERILVVDEAVEGCADLLSELTAQRCGFDFGSLPTVAPDDLLTLIYTSGTTGPPKGVELTHAGMVAQLAGIHAAMPISGGGRQVSFLPAAHIADRWTSHYSAFMTYGNTLTCVADAANLPSCVARTRPTVFGAVPRVWEKFKTAIENSYSGDVLADATADPAIGRALLEDLGFGEIEWSVTGAAPTPPAVVSFFVTLGMPLCEGLGMSEASCLVSVNTPEALQAGSVGRLLASVQARTAEDGELLVRGPQIMRGYRGQPARTVEAIDTDGWLHTGDIARIDDDGFLWIVDRKKELIITAAGKNLSPANIEMAVRSAGNLIGHVCVVGEARPYVVALLCLDPVAVANRALDDPELREAVQAQIDRANATLARVEQIKKFAIVQREWTPGAELTPTMKLRRAAVASAHARDIEDLYATGR